MARPRVPLVLASALGAAVLALFAAPAGAVPGKEKVALARRTKTGDRLAAKEQYRSEKVIHWKGEGQGSANGEEVEVVEREYLQEVTAESPLALERAYKRSTRLKGKPKDDRLTPVPTSIHGKTVVLRPEGATVQGGVLSQEDRDNLDTYERIAYALLPKAPVAAGEEWKVGDEIGKALLRAAFDPTNVKTHGTARLEGLKTVDGRRAAKLAFKVSVRVQATEQLPAIELEVEGPALFLVEEGIFAECAFEGTARFLVHKVEAGKTLDFSSDERVSWKLHADPVLGAPAKPVTKDDDLARANVLKCPQGHSFPNGFGFCAACGKQLDPKTHRCPGGCAPILRFCPLCGQALAPGE